MQNALANTAPFDDPAQRALARRAALIAAAQAAVAWARAQSRARASAAVRLTAPVEDPVAPPQFSRTPLIDAARSAGDAGMTAARGARSASRAAANVVGAAANAVGAIGARVRRVAPPLFRMLPRVAAVALAGAGIWIGVVAARPYVERWQEAPPIERTVPPVTQADLAPPEEPAPGSKKRTGRIVVTSTTDVAKVFVDGKARGITPLTLDGLPAGTHVVLLQNSHGSVEQTVTVGANETARLEQTIYPGWLAIVAPVDLTISEGTRTLRLDDRSQVMLSPGGHDLVFENRALGYQEMRHVEVRPGETTQLSIAPPRSKATFTATAPAEVWIDGTSVGQTPLIGLPVEIGTHHVRMKSGSQERQFTITATMTPLTFNADFSQ